jgi:hypothetical protein
MHPALLKLMGLRLKAWFRRFATRGSLARRIVGAVIFAYFLVSWIASIIISAVSHRSPAADPVLVLQAAPLVLALITALRLATVASSRAHRVHPRRDRPALPRPIHPAPTPDFKIASGSLGSLIIALFVSASIGRLGASWLSAYLALLCALLLIQLVGVLAVLARQRMGQSGYGRATLALVAVVLVAGAVAAFPAIRDAGASNPVEVLRTIAARTHASPIARAVLSPFELPARVLVTPPGLPHARLARRDPRHARHPPRRHLPHGPRLHRGRPRRQRPARPPGSIAPDAPARSTLPEAPSSASRPSPASPAPARSPGASSPPPQEPGAHSS